MNHERRIPTIVALLFLLLTIGGIVALIGHGTKSSSQANAPLKPKEVHTTNLTDSNATISWLTDAATSGSVSLGEGSDKRLYADDRQETKATTAWVSHYVTVKNLSPTTAYTFRIISGDKTYDDDGKPYTFTTGAIISSSPPAIEPAYGRVEDDTGKPAEGAIVYLRIGDSGELSTLAKPTGEWLIAISTMRSANGERFYNPRSDQQQTIVVRAGVDKQAQAITDIDHDSPVPVMTLGKTYNFLLKKPDDQPLAQKAENSNVLGAQPTPKSGKPATPTKVPTKSEKVAILVPESEGALTTTKPLFRGIGIPGKKVSITVQSTPQTGEVLVSADGTWVWSPPENLAPGEHTVTITTLDEHGKEIVQTHTFTILKSGSQVLGVSTPSGTLTPTATPGGITTTPTPILTASTSATPTLTLFPSPTATGSATGGGGKIPVSGEAAPTVLFLGLGTVLMLLGLVHLFRPVAW